MFILKLVVCQYFEEFLCYILRYITQVELICVGKIFCINGIKVPKGVFFLGSLFDVYLGLKNSALFWHFSALFWHFLWLFMTTNDNTH